MKNGLYLVHLLPGSGEYSINFVIDRKILNRKIAKDDSGAVTLVDAVKGNQEFESLEEMIVFFKKSGIQFDRGAVAYLTECLPPSLVSLYLFSECSIWSGPRYRSNDNL